MAGDGVRRAARRAEGPRPAGRPRRPATTKAALLARTNELAQAVKAAEAEQNESAERAARAAARGSRTSSSPACPRAARTTTSCSSTSAAARLRLRAARPPRARPAARRHRHRARRQGVRRALLLPDRCRRAAAARDAQPRDARRPWPGFMPMIPPVLVKPEAMEGTGFLGQAAENVYRLEADDLYLVGTSEVPLAAYHMDEVLRRRRAPAAVRRLVVVLPPRGRFLRQGHPGHHPGAPVRQGRDVLLLSARGRGRRAPAAARLGEGDARAEARSPTG